MDDRDIDERAPLLANSERRDSEAREDSWWAELWLLSEYSLPLIATYLLQYSFTVITTLVAGHLSADDLAAASLGLTTMNIIGFALFEGMATALDTLCAQAYGSGNITGVGLHVQRMLLFMAVACVPVGSFWFFSSPLLAAFIRQHHLAVKAGSFLKVSIIGLPGYAFFEAGKRFLQAQGDFRTGMIVLIVCAPINAFLSWFFTFKLGMGLEGAALGQALANDLRPILLLAYIMLFRKSSLKCWGGLSNNLHQGWGPMFWLSMAGATVCLGEWAAFEILAFSTSYISTIHLAAQSVLATLSVVMWHIPFSISVAVSTRIGHLTGAGLIPAARRATVLYAIVFTVVGVFDGLFLYLLRDPLSLIISDDPSVRDVAIKAMLAVGAFQIIDSIICGCNGLLRGLGRQSIAAWVVFAVNYLGAVPLAIWLELGPLRLELTGIWIGLGLGMVLIAIAECSYMMLIDWHSCTESAKLREE